MHQPSRRRSGLIDRILAFSIFALAIGLFAPPESTAQTSGDATGTAAAPQPFIVATRVAPPFAMQEQDGEWSGISIWLWNAIAADLGIETRFEEASLADMVAGVADGRFDASIAALTITPEREAVVDFSHPFYTTGFGIAVQREAAGWLGLLGRIFTWSFFQAVAALAALLGVIGFFFCLAERHRNREEFGGSFLKGLGSGFWFAAVTMTTVGYGDKAPRTVAGRLIALVWMFGAILIISTFTGMIASALTSERLSERVENPEDLSSVVVGSVPGTSSENWLISRRVGFEGFDSVADGLDALERGAIGAFVYDKPLLQYLVNEEHGTTLDVLPGTYGRQDYGIALPPGSPYREGINRALLEIIESEAYGDVVFGELGAEE
ncbi:transporter substrate-binding domain-containing protein [Jiella marina]|uniref:transporter substrate-binding domain-containing protein n=1 Tax=Jiella sp. LLJ827 TaxID=2917712 RepID=UPI00210158C2|nr:transporter substrate-binding domain-containing protein [Jiella sp. LLJ827]MCQ0988876.1 transporter substrate-binding domain-containing protein [Jiella sp. LLJ827]